ncbi:siroheme synthase CysG [Marinicella meishanensis]|uniref:siroheme synthase CysG n=1 Tax=Marinicella meishanensis TaxID=2873263 RepID=UPI001CC0DCF8|nr:siroheme synthase CysG [Marinicella sp. NBU2979]
MKYLPINLNIEQQPVWVIGGGAVAWRKIKSLCQAGAEVHCVAASFHADIKQAAQHQPIKLITHDLQDLQVLQQLPRPKLVIAATDDPQLNAQIHQYTATRGWLINTVDEPPRCDFITPAVVNRGPVKVAISTAGTAPVLARMIKQKIEYLLPKNLGQIAEQANQWRPTIKQRVPSFNNRRRFWDRFFDWSHGSLRLLRGQYRTPNSAQIEQHIEAVNQTEGRVSLVGAGPGDPDLLTIKAIKVLQSADVVLHDHLIATDIMAMIRQDAELIDVGKQAGKHLTKQQTINQLLIKQARLGKHVCRLKGGDPFVFGRGGEEIQALKAEQIDFEIVPGITAAVGCAAYAGIPLTHRDHAQGLAFITAHCSDSKDAIDWQFYAKNQQTLAVYMGLIKADELVRQLISHGKDPAVPLAVIENGTRPEQRTVTGQLHQLTAMIRDHAIKSPALIVIGEVAAYAQQLDWFAPHVAHPNQAELLKTA